MQQQYYNQPATPQNSWVVALILCFLLGTLGAHRFYIGDRSLGTAQLLLSIIGWCTVWLIIGIIPLVIVGVWAFVDLILIIVRKGIWRNLT